MSGAMQRRLKDPKSFWGDVMNVPLRLLLGTFSAAVLLLGATTSWSQMSPAEQRGQTFAQGNCSKCHAIDKVSPSPLPIAPPFRELGQRRPVDTLEKALVEGSVTGHPNMQEFKLAPEQAANVIAFMKTLQR